MPTMGYQDSRELKERVVEINRVAKVVKGGRRFSFTALVVIGDEVDRVGVGYGKAREVPLAITKAVDDAKKNLFKVPKNGTTIPHEIIGRSDAARVLLRPASEGTGVIAGGGVRAILELAGIRDILAKSLGTTNPINLARATVVGLRALRRPEDFARIRGKTVAEILPYPKVVEEPAEPEPAQGEAAAAQASEPEPAAPEPERHRGSREHQRRRSPKRPRRSPKRLRRSRRRTRRRSNDEAEDQASPQPDRPDASPSRHPACARAGPDRSHGRARGVAPARRYAQESAAPGRRGACEGLSAVGEELNLSNLSPADKRRSRKRIGRGLGSGKGRYSGRGIKGQKSRAGSHKMRPGFEGGQMPIYMRLGKQRGNTSKDALPVGPFRTHNYAVNVRQLERFDDGAAVDAAVLKTAGLIGNKPWDLKILGQGELTKKLTVTAHRFSATAREKIEAAGGTAVALREPVEKKKRKAKRARTPAPEAAEPRSRGKEAAEESAEARPSEAAEESEE